MKNNLFKYIFLFLFISFLIACSTKRDTFLARNSHALSTKYNILYNGQLGFDKGMKAIEANYTDNFWKLLPIERMQIDEGNSDEAKAKNPDFQLAETKATKAIQKHSMNIGGREKNSQIDEAYLMLGQARYYDQRFLPALEAFNYILYKYPTSSNINTARIWREKTNMRLGNDELVIKNIYKLIKGVALKKQVYSDANALLAEAFINLEQKDSAITKLKIAEEFTKRNPQRSRYRFILGQLYQETNKRDSALYFYQSVIDMNRRAERKYVIHAYAKKAQLFDYQNGDNELFIKTYNKLVKDRENRPFLDVIFYEMGVFFDKNKDEKAALEFYNSSLKRKSKDPYLVASAYRNIGNMYFKKASYTLAAKYYDSTLVKMDPKTREYVYIQKTRKNLDDVIKYEGIAQRNDSIINVVGLSDSARVKYFGEYIAKLKTADEAKRILEEKQKEKIANIERNTNGGGLETITAKGALPGNSEKSGIPSPPTGNEVASVFYFYNPSTVAYGKLQFKKLWGNRELNSNWRLPASKSNSNSDDDKSTTIVENDSIKTDVIVEKYTTDFYLKQLPKDKKAIDSIVQERNFSYYQLGLIYKEKFKEYELASNKLEQLLKNNPEEKLILPSMYNLYKIYEITNPAKAVSMKLDITTRYPDSRYAQIINNNGLDEGAGIKAPEKEYQKWYKLFQEEKYATVLNNIDELINQYSGDEIVSKFELLKANTLGKAKGLVAYKKAIENVAENYPNSEEGKKAQDVLVNQIPYLEKRVFTTTDSNNWKILYKIGIEDEKARKTIEDIIKKFLVDENFQKLTYSFDKYDLDSGFVTIHGIKSEIYANDVAKVLKENKKYNLVLYPAVIISSDNYSIVQINKNLEAYLAPKTP
ncbi:gliding motility protein [Flavobacterium sp. EDS]|nr:gliding motility protein [Flavobacterium sp. EDS]MCD0475667.1 gliding motility protein [Flavobacterium sp. EDS]